SGGGGRHLYFAHPGGALPNRVDLFRGIDFRGDGGVIVAPPSIHPSGGRYRWVEGRSPDVLAPAALPRWLLAALAPHGQGSGHPLSFWRDLMREGVAEGGRNNALASISGHLLWHEVDEQVVIELLLAWNRARCRPPLPDAEVVATVESIARAHRRAGQADQDRQP
ncbi:MAG TPA: bifunctional DNA primase/polymerase, partial [Pseudomonadales bacterium]